MQWWISFIFAPEPYWICIGRNFPSDARFLEESVQMNRAMQFINVRACQITGICAVILHPKKACLKLFCAWNGCSCCCLEEAPQRARGSRERIFSTRINLFGMPEEHIIRTYRLPSHVIFHLLQEIKDNLEPLTRSHALPGLIKTSCNPSFFCLRFFLTYCGFFISLLFIWNYVHLCCVYCVDQYVNEMLRLLAFSLICVLVVNHPQKFPCPSPLLWHCTSR